jgi:hypothetical protein
LLQPHLADGDGPAASALYLTSLLPTARVILLNTALGDRAELSDRDCGCPLQDVGWRTHISHIRSYQKVTAGGMTFLDSDIMRVLEEELPARFGGGAADYQLVEDEDESGAARLTLLVHPIVGPLDDDAVAETFLQGISGGEGAEREMGLAWREARLLHVARQPPRTGATGKILHFHQERRPPTPESRTPVLAR